ncbi:tRNA (N6-threonylcarbamoyladenosine(37)-N6)-methyltransferase TrmO [Bacillota bacterium Meth-B3]|nr:tRNA (N6-threonylcarbamoyladenosine(37)-N6)-methyltransferase TrmO [Christensenellaceae bacterium]MEA5068811.1 tRNA (N6-threonylcarbamoyladenosine(37)-N6)-methyltransferase TrmO [Christensenellaceae bacterium]
MHIIAHIHTDFPTKFGVPRQSGVVPGLQGRVVFEPPYRNPDAVRGLEGFSHIWLIWQFSEALRPGWSATVRPPRLGGNRRMGVFATRSPFRPNPIGLSSVRLEGVELDPTLGPVLHVSGIDMLDGTSIYDIKPYLPLSDSHPDACAGFAEQTSREPLAVDFPEPLLSLIPKRYHAALLAALAQDPRPSYQQDPTRRYGVPFAGYDIRFTVEGGTLTVHEVVVS